MQKFYRTRIWPRGPMDKASAYGVGDCRFESCRGHMSVVAPLVHDTSTGFISRQSEKDTGPRNRRLQLRIPPGASCPLAAAVCLPKRWTGITQLSASTSFGQAATNPNSRSLAFLIVHTFIHASRKSFTECVSGPVAQWIRQRYVKCFTKIFVSSNLINVKKFFT